MATVDLIEILAAIEHERWSDWQRYVHSKCSANVDGTLTIPEWAVTNWTRQINTPYADLTEQEKESDREQVRRYLHLVSPEPSRRAAVDVDAVLKLIDEFAAVSVRSIFHPEVTPQINEQFAAIWAMLEGTA